MFGQNGALISVPAGDIAGLKLPGSIFGAEQLLQLDVAPDLKSAVKILKDLSEEDGGRALIVARPEMFTNGETLEWLRRQIAPINDHVCISDGRAIRLVPGLQNHAFFLRLGIQKNLNHLGTLQKRCPELISGLRSQINSALSFPSVAVGCRNDPHINFYGGLTAKSLYLFFLQYTQQFHLCFQW